MKRSTATLLCAATVAAAISPLAYGQCSPTGTGARVDANYNSAPLTGAYKLVENAGNFTAWWYNPDTQQWVFDRVPLADPTIVKIEDWYYVTGTSDHYRTANFAIYKSQDLINWQFHSTAFSDTDGLPHDRFITVNPGRRFCNLWAPQLYVDPGDSTNVWLTFTATEDREAGFGSLGRGGLGYDYLSTYVASVSVGQFENGGPFADPAQGRGHEPMWYHYQVDNTGAVGLDGGWAQTVADSVARTIPVTGSAELTGPSCGQVYQHGYLFGHRCQGTNTWMGLDSFVYFDPTADDRRWMLYAWRVDEAGNGAWDGNHVAAYPMFDNARMDATAAGLHIPLAFVANDFNPPPGHTDNGYSGANGSAFGQGIAEGPAAFKWGQHTYVLYSRNAWDSPAYGIFYRKTASNFQALTLPSWSDTGVAEEPLVTSGQRSLAYGPSYGHGEVFIGPGNRPYLIFHAKQQGTYNAALNRVEYPDGFSGRTVYFKELSFDGLGNLTPITEGPGICGKSAVHRFLVPW